MGLKINGKNLLREYNMASILNFFQELGILDCKHDAVKMHMMSQLSMKHVYMPCDNSAELDLWLEIT